MEIQKLPVVLIHGIKGSQLTQTYDDSFDVIWSAVQERFETVLDLRLDDEGLVDRDPRDLLTVTRIEQLAYGELLTRLRRKFPDAPVYIFRYDWRLDLKRIARQLDDFLTMLEKKNQGLPFRIVTHSMGGLVLLAFLELDPAKNLARTARALLAAPPLWGSVEAVRMLIVGDPSHFNFRHLSSQVYRKLARTFPSVYQLVPGYDGAWAHPNGNVSIWDLDNWQKRILSSGDNRANEHQERDGLMKKHLNRAADFHHLDLLDLNSLSPNDKERFRIVYGVGERTRAQFHVRALNSDGNTRFFFEFDDWSDDGDGTVPRQSALRYSTIASIPIQLSDFSAWWNPLIWDDKAKIFMAGFHAMFLGLDKVQGLVCDWFDGRDPLPDWAEPIRR